MAGRTSVGKKRSRSRKTTSLPKRKWSAKVMRTSDALDLKEDTFKSRSPDRIARSLKAASEDSKRRKGTPFQSAMSMLNFYINRGGKNIPASRKQILEKAKISLRKHFGRE